VPTEKVWADMIQNGIVSVTGDFTLLKYVANMSGQDRERTIGYEKGRLKAGFLIVALSEDESIAPDDFELKASTRWSSGAIKPPD
jgi:hypothetical protein